jgi:hypothetical protein
VKYEYRCLCGYTDERNAAPCDRLIECPECGTPLAPVIHAPQLSSGRATEGKPSR